MKSGSNVRSHWLARLLLGAALLSGVALAQVPDRVGRIAYLSGDVQFYSESAQAWLPAQRNAPVSSRNSLLTGPGSRAEIRFGSTAVALAAQTQLDIQVLDDTRFEAGVPRGSVSLRPGRVERDETYQVLAPAATYTLLQAGRYRVDVADGGSSISVLAGRASAALAADGVVPVGAGQALAATSGGFVRSPARSDALDRWAVQRDDAYRSGEAVRYVSPNMTGYEELDANGRWASDPDYGSVWYPTTYVSAGWAPYRDGHWAYVPPWGWTWIDDAPWGFAPFHYGRWVFIGSRWAWMPGTYVRRPSYAPALVGFIGGSTAGGGVISMAIGTQPAVGWYPLPPWEPYRPAYAQHDRQRRNSNNFNIANPPAHAWRIVERRRVSVNLVQGATVVPREAFVDSLPVRRSALSVAAPVLASPPAAAVPLAAPERPVSAAPSASERPEFGERRGWRETDRRREPAPAPRTDSALPAAPAVQPVVPGSRPGMFRGENRRTEHPAPPAIVAPQVSPPPPLPIAPRQALPLPLPLPPSPPESATAPARREAGPRGGTPEAAAPHLRSEPLANPEPKIERRAEPRAVPRIIEPRVESRPTQRTEPPEVRSPAAQPERRPPAEPGHERRRHGGRERE